MDVFPICDDLTDAEDDDDVATSTPVRSVRGNTPGNQRSTHHNIARDPKSPHFLL